MAHTDPLVGNSDDHALAQAIVNTVREPLLVLDSELRVVSASRSFYLKFQLEQLDVLGRSVYAIADALWNIPDLKTLLEEILPRHSVMEAYEVEHEFSGIGRRTLILNAREVFSPTKKLILLAIEDVTERHQATRAIAELLQQKEVLLQEMQHRIGNSLQIIASILLLKARSVQSEETRMHLHDAHTRVMSVAAVQQQLLAAGQGELIELSPYLTRLCDTLAASMISEGRGVSLEVDVEASTVSSTEAISIGLAVTELVINALKHAFPANRAAGLIVVSYELDGANWRLAVSDNGIGRPEICPDSVTPRLGTSIVQALARQLDGRVEISAALPGTLVSISHGDFSAGSDNCVVPLVLRSLDAAPRGKKRASASLAF
jgi:two-component sensor histidine kinase